MAARESKSPIDPSIHFLLVLIMALLLVVVVGYVIQQTAKNTRASLVCPQTTTDPVKLIENLSVQCPNGVELTKDTNGCSVWNCRIKR